MTGTVHRPLQLALLNNGGSQGPVAPGDVTRSGEPSSGMKIETTSPEAS